MDPARLKFQFNQTKSLQEELKVLLTEIAKERRTSPNITVDRLESIQQTRCLYVDILKECEQNLVNMYRLAIMEGIDVDNSRLLKVFQLFYSKAADIQHLLRCINLPRGSTSIWGIVILTALIYLWATV